MTRLDKEIYYIIRAQVHNYLIYLFKHSYAEKIAFACCDDDISRIISNGAGNHLEYDR